jgi:putative transposase
VMYIDPAYTSQTCSVCGAIGKRVKHRFSCLCGNQRHSDALGRQCAAVNIAGFAKPIGSARGAVNRPEFAHRVRPGVVESSGF